MDIIATVLTESEGKIRHIFDVDNATHAADLMPHIANKFAGTYKNCGDFVIIKLEIVPLPNDGSSSIKTTW